MNKYLHVGPPVYFVITEGFNYSDIDNQNKVGWSTYRTSTLGVHLHQISISWGELTLCLFWACQN